MNALVFRPRFWLEVALPLVALGLLTYWLTCLDADRMVQMLFWCPRNGWIAGKEILPQFLYDYGTWPALAVAIGGLVLFTIGLRSRYCRPARRGAAFMTLAMLLGPGLLVNAIFKGEWGRPRPTQIVEFGGEREYSPYWQSTPFDKGRSFPSGHASMGFFLMMPYFLCRRHQPMRPHAWVWLVVGLAAGSVMGWARMAQGGHFLTDVMWSGGMTYLGGWLADRILHPVKVSQRAPAPACRKSEL